MTDPFAIDIGPFEPIVRLGMIRGTSPAHKDCLGKIVDGWWIPVNRKSFAALMEQLWDSEPFQNW